MRWVWKEHRKLVIIAIAVIIVNVVGVVVVMKEVAEAVMVVEEVVQTVAAETGNNRNIWK